MDLTHEIKYGYPHKSIAGTDEAGRGSWAGPVVAAAIILPAAIPESLLAQLNDSKKLTHKKREELFVPLQEYAHGIGSADETEIDDINILQASLLAMKRAVAALPQSPDHILVDGNKLPAWDYTATALIKGDALSPSIAAASILAKVTRDRIMIELDTQYPVYQWASNKGYGVKSHRA
ncbi:MAG: ribonuclease HII, partial [Alphaproteobacteria bacterium]|nr:ribonuclease HII [Alphaproteobacteria bacterium]